MRLMAEAFAGGHLVKWHWFEGDEQPEGLAFADLVEGGLYLLKRMLAGTEIRANIEGIDFRIHNSGFLSGWERIRSIENCLVAFTACGRFGGM